MSAQNFYRTAKKILIVIVNYRTPTLTIDCLHSLVNEVQSLNTISVVIIDNNSGDRSLEQIEAAINAEGWRNWATTIAAIATAAMLMATI